MPHQYINYCTKLFIARDNWHAYQSARLHTASRILDFARNGADPTKACQHSPSFLDNAGTDLKKPCSTMPSRIKIIGEMRDIPMQ